MICKNKRCRSEIPDGSKFCNFCGKQQTPKKVKSKRANGTGSIVVRKDIKTRPYIAYAPAVMTEKGEMQQNKIGSYATKEEAAKALDNFLLNPIKDPSVTLEELYAAWKKTPRYLELDKNTKNNYSSAWLKLRKLYKQPFRVLKKSDYQPIIDYYSNTHHKEGRGGKLEYNKDGTPVMCEGGLSVSALEKIKYLLHCLYDYAIEEDIVLKKYSDYIKITKTDCTEQTRFTDLHVEVMRQKLDSVDYLDYIYMMCYTGHRINEFLSLTPFDFFERDGVPCLLGGNKSQAGKAKIIPVHPNIYPLVKQCMDRKGQTIFCNKATGKKMSGNYFRERFYYPALDLAGLPHYSPHSCRRTFATRMSAAGVSDDDHIALMGHTEKSVDREHYIIQEAKTLYKAIKKVP